LIAINSTAFESNDDEHPFVGSKTETALLIFARQLGLDSVSVERSNATTVYFMPFYAIHQYMAVVVNLSSNKYRLYVKGAPEVLLAKSTRIVSDPTERLSDHAITAEDTDYLKEIIASFASCSLRTIGLAYRDFDRWPSSEEEVNVDEILKDLVFLAVVGIQDPLRPEAKEAVQTCQKAGVVVRMVTGDNILTAKAISKECGILGTDGTVMEGKEFRSLSRTQLKAELPQLRVIARASPEDKRLLVTQLKDLGEVVAVTGDGTNDTLALAAADIGFSMGISGTEVAKEAAAIILMDDNFASIVNAIMWGRAINDAVKKFLQFQVTITVTSVALAFISAVSSSQEQSVLTPVQLMWVNLIQDTLAALALATDPPPCSILDRKPEPKLAPLITPTMWKTIVGQSVYQLAVTLILYFGGAKILGYNSAHQKSQLQTLVFSTYVWMQIFNQYNCRRIDNKFNILEGVLRNWLFIGISVIMIGCQVLILFVGGRAFSITRLNPAQWGYSLVLGALSIPVGAVIRVIRLEKVWKE
jgi:Ca2+-transporting ATPase